MGALRTLAWLLGTSFGHEAGSAGSPEAPPQLVYLALDGVRIEVTPQRGVDCQGEDPGCGVNDSATNRSWLPALDAPWIDVPPPDLARFGDPEAVRRALVDEVARAFSGINVRVTDERPAPGVDYTMVVVGGSARTLGLTPGIAGFAPLDCGDQHPRDIAFTFSADIPSFAGIVTVTAQEAGHAFGLEHVSAPEFVMYPIPGNAPTSFARTCVPIVADASSSSNPDGIKCVHTCPSPSHQNAYEELIGRLGPDPAAEPPDLTPPTLRVTQPSPGQHFARAPADFRVELEAADDIGVGVATLSAQGGPAVVDPTYPFAFEIRGWPDGAYLLELRVYDAAGNVTDASLEVFVGQEVGPGEVPPGSIRPYLEGPVDDDGPRCTRDRQCPAGTECIDGLCLRPQLTCALTGSPGPGRPHGPAALAVAFALLVGARRRRYSAGHERRRTRA